MTPDKNIQYLYDMQENSVKKVLDDPESKKKSETWLEKDTVDCWRHKRMRDSILPLIKNFPGSAWLTVGDGRYGTDANYLLEKGLDAHASDIQDDLLRIGNEKNFIKDFSKQNAESLSFRDNQFDFVYCKESYHHFPRPAVALYEMLRVAKKGIILQEPKDALIFETLMQNFFYRIKRLAKSILVRKKEVHPFEISGNYAYSLSPRELQKYALGLHYEFVAYKVQQDCYIKGVEFEKAGEKSKLFKKIKRNIRLFEFLYKIGLANGGILTGIIFKAVPGRKLIGDLKFNGYETEILTKNPHSKNEKN